MSPSDRYLEIAGRRVGPGYPTYVIAEVSGNHNGEYDRAARIIEGAAKAGADAIKLQTYTADTITIDHDSELFTVSEGGLWGGRTMYDLYSEAYTPWDWQPKLKKVANDLGLELFSSPFDHTAADFLDEMGVPAFKIASFESSDPPLIKHVASKGKPVLISTGMAPLSQIEAAVAAARDGGAGAHDLLLFKCSSAYPAPPSSMNLSTIPHMADSFDLPVGLSDHTLGWSIPVAAVALGACAVEKHVTWSREDGGPDAAFSLEPHEFKEMVNAIREIEAAVGSVQYGPSEEEQSNTQFKRSLIVTESVSAGESFTPQNVRSIRPGYGLPPEFITEVIGRSAASDIARGTPLSWDLVSGAPRNL